MARGKARLKKVPYPCPVCDKTCGRGTIHCTACGMWVHPACVPLTAEEFKDYGESEDYFLCPRCVSTAEDDVGLFDMSKSLNNYCGCFSLIAH